jgi:hypothetical protein
MSKLKKVTCDIYRQWILNWRHWKPFFNSKYRIKQLLSFDSVNVWIYWLLKKIIFTEGKKTIIFFLKVNKSTHLQNQKTVIVYYWPFVYFSLIFVHYGLFGHFSFHLTESDIVSINKVTMVTLTLKIICHCDVKHIMMLLIKKNDVGLEDRDNGTDHMNVT